MLLLIITTVHAGFFAPAQGGNVENNGLWAAVTGFFTSSACFPNWELSAGSCLINNTKLKVYTDANNCDDTSTLPADNATYHSTCDYCGYSLTYLYTSTCTYQNDTQSFEINGTVYDSAWSTCCAATGLSNDCYSSDTALLNYTYNGPFTCEEPDKMWYVAIAIFMVGIFSIFIFIAKNWEFTLFDRGNKDLANNNNAIKVFLIWLSFWLVMPLIQLMIEMAEANSATSDIITLLNTFYTADMLINYVISAYFVIYFIFNILLYFGIDIVGSMQSKRR